MTSVSDKTAVARRRKASKINKTSKSLKPENHLKQVSFLQKDVAKESDSSNDLLPIAWDGSVYFEGIDSQSDPCRILFYATCDGSGRRLHVIKPSSDAPSQPTVFDLIDESKLELEDRFLIVKKVVPRPLVCFASFRIRFEPPIKALAFYRRVKAFYGGRAEVKGCPKLTKTALTLRRLGFDSESITLDEDSRFLKDSDTFPIDFKEEKQVLPSLFELHDPLRIPIFNDIFGKSWFWNEIEEQFPLNNIICEKHDGLSSRYHDNLIGAERFCKLNDEDIIYAVQNHKTTSLRRPGVQVLFDTPFNLPHPYRRGLLSAERWQPPFALDKGLPVSLFDLQQGANQLANDRQSSIKKAANDPRKWSIYGASTFFEVFDFVWCFVADKDSLGFLPFVLAILPRHVLQPTSGGQMIEPILTHALFIDSETYKLKSKQILTFLTSATLSTFRSGHVGRWLRFVRFDDGNNGNGVALEPEASVYWAIAVRHQNWEKDPSGRDSFKSTDELVMSRKRQSDNFKAIAVAENVDATSDWKLPSYTLRVVCYASNNGERHLEFTNVSGEPIDETAGRHPNAINRRYTLTSTSARMYLIGNLIEVRCANADSSSQNLPRGNYTYHHVTIKFRNGVEEATAFYRQVKAFIGDRVDAFFREPCFHTDQKLLERRRMHDVLGAFASKSEDIDYYRRVSAVSSPEVRQLCSQIDDPLRSKLVLPSLDTSALVAATQEAKQAIEDLFSRRKGLCVRHEMTFAYHDVSKAVGAYSRINDLDILAAVMYHRSDTLTPQYVSPLFETPFNFPHPLARGPLGSTKVCLADQVTKTAPGEDIFNELSTYRKNNLKKVREPGATDRITGAPYPEGDVYGLWCFIVSIQQRHSDGDDLEPYSYKCQTISPCLLVVPKALFQQEKIAIFNTQALLPDQERPWRIGHVVVALTQPSKWFKAYEDEAVKERWLRIVEVGMSVGKGPKIRENSQKVHWALVKLPADW